MLLELRPGQVIARRSSKDLARSLSCTFEARGPTALADIALAASHDDENLAPEQRGRLPQTRAGT